MILPKMFAQDILPSFMKEQGFRCLVVWSFAHCWECMTEEKQYSCGNCSKITKTFNLLSKDRHLGQETCRSRVCNFILPEFIGAYHKPLRMLPGSLGIQKENKPKSHQNSTSAVPVQCALCRCPTDHSSVSPLSPAVPFSTFLAL